MPWFKKKKNIVVSAPTMGVMHFRGPGIEIRPPQIPYPGANTFLLDVARSLEKIEEEVLGYDLIQDLLQSGRVVKITYQQLNFARCGVAGMYELCYQYFKFNASGSKTEIVAKVKGMYREFADELKATLLTANYSADVLAKLLVVGTLYSWKNGTSHQNPFGGATKVKETKEKIEGWLAGDLLPANDEFDLVSQTLEAHMKPGEGVNVQISFDPLNNNGRPAEVGLFHELVHAYYTVHGRQLGIEDSSSEFNGGRHFELMSTGFAPHANRKYGENKYRQAVAQPARTDYP